MALPQNLKRLNLGNVPWDGTHLKMPTLPSIRTSATSEQCNLSDPDAPIMRKNKCASFTQSDHAPAAVDADGGQLVVGQHVSQSASDYAELEDGVSSIPG